MTMWLVLGILLAPCPLGDSVVLNGETTFLNLDITGAADHSIGFVVGPMTRVGYDAERQRIRAEVTESEPHVRKFLMWLPGKEAGTFSIDGTEVAVNIQAAGMDLKMTSGKIQVDHLEKTQIRGHFEGTAKKDGKSYQVKGRFFLPAYIR